MRRARRWFSVVIGGFLCLSGSLSAQAPNERWRTIRTAHFNVHFPEALEPIARRGAGSAERAWERLAPLLKPARGRIELVITDHVDYTNGFAWVSPTPRIVVQARPPIDDRTLRFRDDWFDLVVQHELVHVFHLDRTRGWWRVAQWVFGRQPLLFPNAWAPSWLLEGLAVHYESALGDGGRTEGGMHTPWINAKAMEYALPRFGGWSQSTLEFPGGASVYAYGAELVEAMYGRGGNRSVEDFIERTSGRLFPWSFERSAQKSFGATFAWQWRRFADSVIGAVQQQGATSVRAFSNVNWTTRMPRRTDDGRLLYTASTGREVASLYEVSESLNGTPRRLARRNSYDANVALSDGRVLFAQDEWVDPWRLRSDLWMREADGREHRLTHGARVFAPDVRRDGAIVAAQVIPGSTRLVRVSAAGEVRALTGGSLDTTWSAPRWSHDGTRIAATRWAHGGEMSIVVLDSIGRDTRVLVRARGVLDEPAWTADDSSLLFSANVDGTSHIWSVELATGALRQLTDGATSFDSPTPGLDGFVAIETRAHGERLVRVNVAHDSVRSAPPDSLTSRRDAHPFAPATPATGPMRRYAPFRQLVPRYLMPLIETTDENRTRVGGYIGGSDVVGRHTYAASFLRESFRGENTGTLAYRFAGLGLPLVDVAFQQEWDHSDIVDSANSPLGTLSRRRRFAGTALTFLRQRARNAVLLRTGAELEWRDFVTDPAPLRARLSSPLFRQTLTYPTFTTHLAWSNTRAPLLAFGPEDGASAWLNARWRWRSDAPTATRSATYIGSVAAYKSVGFIPAPWHHVVAVRAAAGITDDKTNTQLEAGGTSGASAIVVPGVVVGDARQTFFVRGFDIGAQAGIRALGGSAEWRAPVKIADWGKGFIPFFAQRFALTVFSDAAAAWCPAGARVRTFACPRGATSRDWMASVGSELALDAALFSYDVPFRFRFGYARPVLGRAYASAPNGSTFFSLGMSF